VHAAGFHLGVGSALEEKKAELEAFLHEQVYRHEKLIQQRKQAQNQLREMFLGFQQNPHWLPKRFQQRADEIGLKRSVADYIAGMTDRYCQQQYQRLFASNAGGSSVETVC
jgi:dGTPase